ncbi:hypothetical protein os1_08350 [Comamonadaceae bacterium OS-1]|nr:hypothetical protein os1_08350 [Comamonadaceae bacterium OS-1]
MSLITELVSSRKRLQLTQADVARAAGLSRMTVQRIEAGEIDPRLTTVLEMSRVLQLDVVAVPAPLRQEVEAFVQSRAGSLQPLPTEAAASVTKMLTDPDTEGNGSA